MKLNPRNNLPKFVARENIICSSFFLAGVTVQKKRRNSDKIVIVFLKENFEHR